MSIQTIDSSALFDRLAAILAQLSVGKKHDPSWMRPIPLTHDERRSDYLEAEAIIEELRKRSNARVETPAGYADESQKGDNSSMSRNL